MPELPPASEPQLQQPAQAAEDPTLPPHAMEARLLRLPSRRHRCCIQGPLTHSAIDPEGALQAPPRLPLMQDTPDALSMMLHMSHPLWLVDSLLFARAASLLFTLADTLLFALADSLLFALADSLLFALADWLGFFVIRPVRRSLCPKPSRRARTLLRAVKPGWRSRTQAPRASSRRRTGTRLKAPARGAAAGGGASPPRSNGQASFHPAQLASLTKSPRRQNSFCDTCNFLERPCTKVLWVFPWF